MLTPRFLISSSLAVTPSRLSLELNTRRLTSYMLMSLVSGTFVNGSPYCFGCSSSTGFGCGLTGSSLLQPRAEIINRLSNAIEQDLRVKLANRFFTIVILIVIRIYQDS